MSAEAPPQPRGKSISNQLNAELIREFLAMPAVLNEVFEETEGAAEIPPEELAQAMSQAFWIMLRYLQALAGEVDRLRFRLGLDQEPGPFGPPD